MTSKSSFLFLALAFVFSAGLPSQATENKPGSPPLADEKHIPWGPEWTFTSNTIPFMQLGEGFDELAFYLHKIHAVLNSQAKDSDYKVSDIRDEVASMGYAPESFTVTYKNGFWFQVTMDYGVLEVKAKPLTIQEWEEMAPTVQRHLFDSMASVGLHPDIERGGGHIHAGAQEAFRGNPRILAAYLTDLWSELENDGGILRGHTRQAPEIHEYSLSDQKAYNQILSWVEQGRIKSDLQLASLINKLHPLNGRMAKGGVSVWRITSDNIRRRTATLETRKIRPQKDMKTFILILKLLEARLKFVLENKLEPLTPIEIRQFRVPEDNLANREKQVRWFYKFVTESGLDFDDYRTLLTPDYESIATRLYPSVKPLKRERKKVQKDPQNLIFYCPQVMN